MTHWLPLLGLVTTLGITQNETIDGGTFKSWERGAQYFLAAPHGGFDLNTDKIVASVCEDLSWDCLTATGFRTKEHPINVNRPTEGVGEAPDHEQVTERAQKVYNDYHARVLAMQPAALKLYLEVHGNSREESRREIEIATVGISAEKAQRIKTLLTGEMKKAGLGDLKVLIEPVDEIHYTAAANKQKGMLHDLSPAMHFELPRSMRSQNQSKAIEFFSSALPRLVDSEFP